MRKIILAVDDDRSVLHSLGRVFRQKSYEFIPFDSPIPALLSLKSVKPHVIISDRRLPHINGVDFLSRSKNISQKSFRILLTGFGNREDHQKDHIDRVMFKPWCSEELEMEVEQTSVHADRIVVSLWDSPKNGARTCGMCGHDAVDYEVRYDSFTEFLCEDCRAKLDSYAGSSLEPMIFRQMLGNVL
jgi:DNA-binding NtrC family response regulator